jgi:hypothetical protein
MNEQLIIKNTPRIKAYFDGLIKLSSENEIMQWRGVHLLTKMFYLYLVNKYKTQCIGYSKVFYAGSYFHFAPFEITLHKNVEKETKNLLYIADVISNCIKNKVNIIPIPIRIFKAIHSAHANVLIYRRKTNTFEHFEPHGSSFGHVPKFTSIIKGRLREFVRLVNVELHKKKLPKTHLVNSNVCCPYINGLQNIECRLDKAHESGESNGYCAAWSMLFTELVFKNPTIDSLEINKIIFEHILPDIDNQPLYLRKTIRGFVIKMNQKIEKYFTKLFGKEVYLGAIYREYDEHDHHFEFMMDFFINEEILKNYDSDYDAKKKIDLLKEELKKNSKNYKAIDELKFLERADVLNKLTPPTNISIMSHNPSSLKQLTNKKLPKCPNGTVRNKITGKCEPKNKDVTKKIEPKKIEPKKIEPKKIEPKKIEPKKIEPKKIEPKKIEPKKIEPKKIEPKKIEPKLTSKKKKLPKCPNGTRRNKKTGNCDPHPK